MGCGGSQLSEADEDEGLPQVGHWDLEHGIDTVSTEKSDRNRYNERNQYACSCFYTDIYNNRLNTWSRGHVLLQNWRQQLRFELEYYFLS